MAGLGGLPASGVSAVAINVTIVATSAGGANLQIWPDGGIQPSPSTDMIISSTAPIANFDAFVSVGSGDAIDVLISGINANIIIDVEGWYG